MKLFDKFKYWCDCKINGKKEEYKEYKLDLKLKKKDIDDYKRHIKEAKENKYLGDGSKKLEFNLYNLDEARLAMKFIRPNSKQDIEYREEQADTFPTKLQQVLLPDLDLRFHGTPIYFAEQIIKSGRISSSADRYDGYKSSTDTEGNISVTNRETIGKTINYFSDILAYRRSLPCGCVFAVLPKEDDIFDKERNLMSSVNFQENPEQLFGIFTSPENINQVKKWMNESKFNPDLVYTFEEFLKVVEEKSKEVDKKNEFKKMVQNTEVEDIPSNNIEKDEIKDMNHSNQEIENPEEQTDEDRD